jgi:hypothetical protein
MKKKPIKKYYGARPNEFEDRNSEAFTGVRKLLSEALQRGGEQSGGPGKKGLDY